MEMSTARKPTEGVLLHKASGFTRNEILLSIKLNGSMTADELGKELGISPVAVRQHLSSLEAEGYVSTNVERRGLGRPVHRYSITLRGDETFPRRYDSLANSLLDELGAAQGEDGITCLFAARRQKMASSYGSRLDGKPLGERVAELAKIQTELGFMAEARPEDGGYLLSEHNCAICSVARNHPIACQEELTLFQDLLGEGVAVVRDRFMLDGDHVCSYRIKELPPSSE
jgi:iron-sulfur cluster biosynthesis transcriptional regulator SufR